MTRRKVQNTLIATAAAGALITAPALARPAGDPASGPTTTPRQDLRGADARGDGPRQYAPSAPTWGSHPETLPKVAVPGQPTWPVDPKPLPRAAVPAEVPASDGNGDGGDGVWLILGLGVGGAALIAGGAAGLARHSRVRARRVAV